MPRRRRPGPRQNRSDLPPSASPGQPAPPITFTGRPQGERQASLQAQEVAPPPDRSVEALTNVGTGTIDTGAGAAGPTDAGAFQQFLAAAQQAQPPGDGLLAAPSQRPGEPVTAGLSTGPGAGPEVLPLMQTGGPDPSVILWQQYLPALDLIASRPGSSPELRQFYRRIRSSLPPGSFDRQET